MNRERKRGHSMTKALRKLSKGELLNLTLKISGKEAGVTKKATKSQLISAVSSHFDQDSTHTSSFVADIELHDTSWRKSASEIQIFIKNFKLFLDDLCDCEISETLHDGSHWIVVHVTRDGRSLSGYLVHTPLSNIVFVAGLRHRDLAIVMEALCMAGKYGEWEPYPLTGRDIHSLLDLALNPHSQGPYSRYRLNQVDTNPLLAVGTACPPPGMEGNSKQEMVEAELAFGCNPLPKIKKCVFDAVGSDGKTESKLVLSGSNVLEGLRECIASGLVTLPLPHTLADMHQRLQTTITFTPQDP